MKAIILAAGYGTRFDRECEEIRRSDPERYGKICPLVEGRPKPLVLVAGKPLIQYTIENIQRAGINEIFIVTNNRYHKIYQDFVDSLNHCSWISQDDKIRLINDGTDKNEERLGAVNDLLLVLKDKEIDDDVLVVSGDNLFNMEFREMIDFYDDRKTSILLVYREEDKQKIGRSACVEFDDDNLVVSFEEKPSEPKSEWICPSIYIYTRDTIRLIKEMKFEEDKKDLMGNIPMLLYSRIPIHALAKKDKIRFDLGTTDDLEKADEFYKARGSSDN